MPEVQLHFAPRAEPVGRAGPGTLPLSARKSPAANITDTYPLELLLHLKVLRPLCLEDRPPELRLKILGNAADNLGRQSRHLPSGCSAIIF